VGFPLAPSCGQFWTPLEGAEADCSTFLRSGPVTGGNAAAYLLHGPLLRTTRVFESTRWLKD